MIDKGHDAGLTRRSMIGMLVGSAVLPVVGAEFAAAQPTAVATAGVATAAPDRPLRDVPKPGLRYQRLTSIAGRNHRVTFWQATWDGPDGRRVGAVVRDLEVAHAGSWLTVCGEPERFDEQWLVVAEDNANLIGGGNYGASAKNWLAIGAVRKLDAQTAELTAALAGGADLTIRWTVDRDQPELQWTLRVHRDSNYVVGYQSGAQHEFDAVDEVLCGALQHAKVIASPTALLAWELFAPMSLIQGKVGSVPVTTGTFVPADVLLFEHERTSGWDNQPFGMSLRNLGSGIQTCVYAPPGGTRSALKAGQRVGYAFGVLARPGTLYDAQVALSRDEYGLDRYRRNIFGTSLTSTIHNIIDLISIDPDGDDSDSFVPSLSGWWSRGKGFANIELDQQIRTAAGSVVLGAGLVASRPDEHARLWDRRARPMIEYIASRHDYAYSPKTGFGNYPLGGWFGDVNTMGPAALMLRGASGGLNQLAMDAAIGTQVGNNRSPWSTPLSAYLVSGDDAWLTHAVHSAKWYARRSIDTPYTTNIDQNAFGTSAVKTWLELQVLYEITGDQELLRAAIKEARRYLSLFDVRPVPAGQVGSPVGEPIDSVSYLWKVSLGIPDYELTEPPSERVEKWVVSTTGLTFEQLSTFKIGGVNPGGGFTRNPIWAPFLARLAHQSGDTFMRDVTHNMVIGRFTNYPGYYDRQFVSWPMHPEYPLRGPFGTACIYYHHAPAQLGLAVDYLVSEHYARSEGRIDFPYAFEAMFVYFKYHLYGHAPGTFYGDDGVWPYFPKGIVDVSNPQLNWLTGVSATSFYVSLTNASPKPQAAVVTFDPQLTGVDPARSYSAEVIADGRSLTTRVTGGRLRMQVSGHGITAVKIRGAGRLAPWHQAAGPADRSGASFHLDDLDGAAGTTNDQIRGMALPRPDRSGYDVYVSTGLSQPVSLKYQVGDGDWQNAPSKLYPYEWTIPVDDLRARFSYQVSVNGVDRPEVDLYLPGSVTGSLPIGQPAGGELTTQGSATPASTMEVTAKLRNSSGTTLTGPTVTIVVPAGWSVAPVVAPPSTLADGAAATATYKVTVASTAAVGDAVITGTLNWAGGQATLTETRLKVISTVTSVGVVSSKSVVNRGEAATVTAAFVNRGTVPRSGTLNVTVSAGWTAAPTTAAWTIEAGAMQEHDVVVTPTTAALGSIGSIRIDLGPGAGAVATSIRVANPDDLIIIPGDPAYSESGIWLASGLAGYGGSPSRYSPAEAYGQMVTWKPSITQAGTFQVSVWYPTNGDTTKDALYTVTTPGGPQEIHVDQTDRANQWRELGVFDLEPGDSVSLTAISGLYTRANACRFTRR